MTSNRFVAVKMAAGAAVAIVLLALASCGGTIGNSQGPASSPGSTPNSSPTTTPSSSHVGWG
jgi:hypothetical protein